MTVSRIESGYDPKLSTVYELARALGMELMLVPQGLRTELESFVQSGGRMLAQPPGSGAPKSVVQLLGERELLKEVEVPSVAVSVSRVAKS